MTAFSYLGKTSSSEILNITSASQRLPRKVFWDAAIQGACAMIPPTLDPVYIATGGGYAPNDSLIEFLKDKNEISGTIPSIKGDLFRNLPAFQAEQPTIRTAITSELGERATPEAVEQILNSFYSDEVNTRIAKEVVKATVRDKKSCIYESASIYPDTLERASLAKQHGVKTVLIAGDQDIETAIKAKKGVEPANVVTSYQKFAARFESELVGAFDEIKLYNTDQSPPVLIAQKSGAGQELQILNPELYGKFTAKRVLDPKRHETVTAPLNVIYDEHVQNRAQGQSRG